MTDQHAWEAANDAYLSGALQSVRLRLQHLADQHRGAPEATPVEPRRRFWERKKKEPILLPASTSASAGAADPLRGATTASSTPDAQDLPPALTILSRRLGLVPFEESILLLCAAMEIDTRIAGLCAQAQGDMSRPYPTFALALALFDDPVWEALSPERPLRYWRLVEINQPGAQPLTVSALRADERVVSYLKGLNYLDDRLAPLLSPIHAATELPPSHRQQATAIAAQLSAGFPVPVVNLLGTDGPSKQAVAVHAAASLDLAVYRLTADVLPTALPDLETLARLWQRESQLLPLALYVDAHDADKEIPSLTRFLSRTAGLVFLDTRDAWPYTGRDVIAVDIAKPSRSEQQETWRVALRTPTDEIPALLAGQFTFNVPAIHRIAAIARDPDALPLDRLWDACLMASRPRLDTLAQRLELTGLSWDDLVLPETEKSLLRQIIDQVGQRRVVYEDWGFGRRMNRGLGISALFAGESGTGKTLAAEVIAHELRLNLYRIDLSQVVSKYIGETEKNLRRLFDAAEDGGTILFFDEADALFGKRSEVKDSHDRYANIEVNYLLQRMEAYRGLAILATNMKSALDTAFMRRLRFIVNFPFPGVGERERMWARAFPAEANVKDLDFAQLARLNLTGGSIQNIAVNAAFLAARNGGRVAMAHVTEAARREFRKLDKPVNESEFRGLRPAAEAALA